MSKNKNPVKPAVAPAEALVVAPAVGAGAAAEVPVETLTTPEAKSDETKTPEAKPKNKIQVRSLTGGTFINPFTQEEVGPAETEATNDSWLQSQLAARKIEQV